MLERLIIATQRLRLVAATVELAQSDRATFSQLLAASLPDDYPPAIVADFLLAQTQQLATDPSLAGWLAWYWICQNPQPALIGVGGFGGKPQIDGGVDLGYVVFDQYQNQGYATEAVRGLLSWVFSHLEVLRVQAQIYPHLKASIRVLEKNGFQLMGEGDERGTLRYELSKPLYAPNAALLSTPDTRLNEST